MRNVIIAGEEFTHKVFVGFEMYCVVSGLGRSLNVLLVEGIDTIVPISAVADLNEVPMVA